MRNRLAHIDARNMRDVATLLEQLARRIGFRLAPGFGERVVFRELFDRGLTVLDLPSEAATPSQQAARRELDDLLQAIGLVPAPR
jgi:chromosome partitioning protein